MFRSSSVLSMIVTGVLLLGCQTEGRIPEGKTPNAEVTVVQKQAVKAPVTLSDFHHDQKIICKDCHADGFKLDDNESVQNAACVTCHAPHTPTTGTSTASISAHRSHLGKIGCTTCHHGHTASQAYCMNCHLFDMRIPFQGSPEMPSVDLRKAPNIEDSTDVVVIGSGGAGLSAAIAIHDLGARVIVLEKQPLTGGNTLLSAGGMNAANTQFQRSLGIEDSVALMVSDTLTGGQQLNDRDLVNILAANSAGSVDWLTSLGVDLSDVGKLAGASVKRAHRPKGGKAIGAHLIEVLRRNVAERQIDVRINSKVVKIAEDAAGKVQAVHVFGKHRQLYAIATKAVVIAAGGFSANPERVAYYRPDFAGMITSNQPGATGDGMDVGLVAGGQVIDMAQIQIHPTLAAGSRILITEAVRGNGAILVNREGTRFVNEMTTRGVVSAAVLAQTGKTAFVVFDQPVRDGLAQIEGYLRLGLVRESDTLDGLASALGIPAGALPDTLQRYNEAFGSDSHEDPQFHRSIPRPINTPKFYAIEVAPGIHYTMGGLKIDVRARVISTNGTPIPGLFAAGEVTGGVHGADRLGGNSISETITYGRIAGAGAVEWVHAQ